MEETRILFCSDRDQNEGEADGFARLSRGLVDLELARPGPGRPRLLVSGPLHGPAGPDFPKLRRKASRARKHAARRARTGRLETVLLLPELTECAELEEAARTGLAPFRPGVKMMKASENARQREKQLREADLAIGVAGPQCLEYCASGLGQILIPLDASQNALASELDRTGAAMKIAAGDDVAIAIERAVADLLEVPAMFRLMREAALDLCEALEPETMVAALSGLLGAGTSERAPASARGSA